MHKETFYAYIRVDVYSFECWDFRFLYQINSTKCCTEGNNIFTVFMILHFLYCSSIYKIIM